MKKAKTKQDYNLRFNIIIAIIYIIGIILLVKLFTLQIVEGEDYREASNTKLTRETTIHATRGNILDASGNKLVSTSMVYSVEIYKTKIDNDTLNNSLLLFAKTMDENGDKYVDQFPIVFDSEFRIKEGIDFDNWKKKQDLDENYTVEECFNHYVQKYDIKTEDKLEQRKIANLRYIIDLNGYSSTRSIKLATHISNNSVAKLNEMSASFPGITTYSDTSIAYPYGELASHILGYTGAINEEELAADKSYNRNDVIGKTGLERTFEKYLRGKNGTKLVDVSVDGVVMDEYVSEEAVAGSNIILTLDVDLQKQTERALAKGIHDISSATEGAAVVLNCNTGEVLAMASYPNYNPALFIDGISTTDYNNYINDSRHPFINKAISDTSAPGSTFKMVTAIAGLQSGGIKVDSTIGCSGRYTRFDTYQPYCWNKRGHGYLSVTQAIERSCNYFFYETGYRSGIKELNRVARAFGLGSKTGIELPNETPGVLAGPDSDSQWSPGKTVQAAIGQSNNSFTPLQMAKYTAMIANGGKNIDVTIIKDIENPDGTKVSRNEIDSLINEENGVTNSGEDLNFTEEHLKAIKEGMKGVTTDDGGTAVGYFRGFSTVLGGKTGSASVDERGNANAWFVGFAPYDNPEVAVAVYIKLGQHGAAAAPVAREILAQYFGMNQVDIKEDVSVMNEEQSTY